MENSRENEWEGCLVEKGSGREKWWSPTVFSLNPPKFNLSKIGRKWERKWGRYILEKIALLHPTANLLSFSTFCLSPFFLAWIKFLLVCMVRLRWFGFGFGFGFFIFFLFFFVFVFNPWAFAYYIYIYIYKLKCPYNFF